MIKIKSDKIIVNEEIFNGYLYIENDKIVEVSTEDKKAEEFYDYTGFYVSAGFIDTHTHGAGGYCFLNSSIQDVVNACNFHLKFGMTTIAPTVSASKFSEMKNAVEVIDKAKNCGEVKNNLLGAHLEGPYLSPKQAGAQRPDFITPPIKEDYIPLINKYGNSIARWTYAPESDVNGEFCKYLTDNGIVASAGHTDATYKDMKVAIDNGCNLVTHLYSCTSTITRNQGFRSLGVIESTFLRDELTAELICDGKHLPPDLINMIIKIKGENNIILTTDSLEIAGTDIKEGGQSGSKFIVEDGVCKLYDRSAFAGSIATANVLVRTLYKECGVSLPIAVKMLTSNPAKLFNLNKGLLKKDYDADVIVFDDDINVSNVFVNGKKVI